MIIRRLASQRGHADHGWLEARHSFSFGEYHDPAHMGFRTLRVINDDIIQGGQGFGMHGHRDMEIVTYVLEGALEHKDSMGNGSVLRHGDVQRMSAGRGVMHSEFNHSATEPLRLLQIWLLPEQTGIDPGYEERPFDMEGKRGQLQLIASPDPKEEAMHIHQDVRILAATLAQGETVAYDLAPGRHAWIQVAHGSLTVNGVDLDVGDGAAVSDETALRIEGGDAAEFLVFDLA